MERPGEVYTVDISKKVQAVDMNSNNIKGMTFLYLALVKISPDTDVVLIYPMTTRFKGERK